MRITGTRLLLVIVLLTLLLAVAGGSLAQAPLDPEPVEVAGDGPELSGVELSAVVSMLLPYQGRLTVPGTGQPVADGDYTMAFSLYNVDVGGSALWTETKTVSVVGGLFSTNLGDGTALNQNQFNGQGLWLGIKVGADAEAAPRVAVLPVAYAFSVVPGASVSGATTSPGLSVTNTGSGHALYGNSSNSIGVYGASNTSRGVYGVSSESYGVYGASKGTLAAVYGANTGTGYSGHFYKPGGVAVYAQGSVTVTEGLRVDGTTTASLIKYSTPRTHYLSIPAEAFVPGSNVDYVNTYGMGGAYISSGSGALVAPVQLPDGAIVTAFRVYFDDASSADMTVSLQRLSFTSGAFTSLASVNSSGTGGYTNATDTTISNATISNNSGWGYLVYAYASSWSSSLKLMGVIVTYTVSEVE